MAKPKQKEYWLSFVVNCRVLATDKNEAWSKVGLDITDCKSNRMSNELCAGVYDSDTGEELSEDD